MKSLMHSLRKKKTKWIRLSCGWSRLGFAVWLALPVGGAGVLAARPFPAAWVNEATGYAIAVYDPVNYFVEGKALRPAWAVEAYWGLVSWKFRNIGNKAAFLDHPEIYAPRFGGLDPFLLLKGRFVRGKPILFDVFEQRLYLFYDKASVSLWKKHRAAYASLAAQNWPRAAAELGLDARRKQ